METGERIKTSTKTTRNNLLAVNICCSSNIKSCKTPRWSINKEQRRREGGKVVQGREHKRGHSTAGWYSLSATHRLAGSQRTIGIHPLPTVALVKMPHTHSLPPSSFYTPLLPSLPPPPLPFEHPSQ